MENLKKELNKILESASTIDAIEQDVKIKVNQWLPNIHEYVNIEFDEICFDEIFFKENNGILLFIPYIFTIKEDFFYKLFIGDICTRLISFNKILDPSSFGYEVTINEVPTEVRSECKISLLTHNQKIYDQIIESINNGEHSIFYSEATGLGKSFIFMRLVYDLFKGKKVLYIVPKIAIWENMRSYKEFEYIKDYVEMTTYMDFNSIKDHHYEYNAIFIDECHHLISDIQGNNIINICNEYTNNNKFVFGFTATPKIKTKGRLVSVDMYFNSKVYGLNIEEAMKLGLFSEIKYAIADPYTIIDDEKYCKNYSIDGTKTLLENILNEHNNITRWLVYFNTIATLNENLSSIKKLFPDYKIFTMHNKNKDNDKELKEFNSCTEKSMLLTVSMVLEGVHPKNVGGILLYRNITNYHTFLQVLGRICSIKSKINPVCVDITNCVYDVPLSYIEKFSDYNNKHNKIRAYNIKQIVDIESHTYRYINLLSDVLSESEIKEYRGITWKTNVELSIKLNKSPSYVKSKLKQGFTHKEIIDSELDKYNTYRGYTYKDQVDLSRQLGCNDSYVCRLIRRGKYNSCEEIIDAKCDGKLDPKFKIEYNGTVITSVNKLAQIVNSTFAIVDGLLKNGYTAEDILKEFIDNGSIKYINAKEYGGIRYLNTVDLSKQINVKPARIRHLKRVHGFTEEQIIDKFNAGEKI